MRAGRTWIRGAGWLGIALAAGCAPAGPSVPPLSAVPPSGPTHLDGVYQGSRTPEGGCGFAEQVGYEVSGGSIWQRGRGDSHILDGAISPTGQFRMVDDAGDRVISGAISGDHLAGTDTSPPAHHKHQRDYVQIPDEECHAQIDARRVTPGHAGAPD